MRVVCISDTHQQHRSITVPDGDLLIHAGDITGHGSLKFLKDFADWFAELPHANKVVIAGNHDTCFEDENREQALGIFKNLNYLEDSGIEIEGRKIWGSPVTPWFHDWAFNVDRGVYIREHWNKIPRDTDILVTHGPPFGFHDQTSRGPRVGCEELRYAVEEIKPLLHVFGHIHEDYGTTGHVWGTLPDGTEDGTYFINASTCTLQYAPDNPPVVIDIPDK